MKVLSIIFTSAFIFFNISSLYAQDETMQSWVEDAQGNINIEDTSSNTWQFGGIFHLNLGQSALSHWAAGGDKSSFSLTGLFNGYTSYKKNRISWKNIADLAYGYTKTSSTGYRKSDDHLYLTSQLGYATSDSSKWSYSVLADFKTQFSTGYLYNDDEPRTLNSDFLSPAYLLVSAGMSFKPTDYFTLYISPITERWTFVRSNLLSDQGKFGVDSGAHSFNEMGAFVSARFEKEFSDAISLTSRLDLFSNYKNDPQNVDIYFTNLLALKITKYLATTISLNMIYDDDIKFPVEGKPEEEESHLQIQEVLGIGLSYQF